MFCCKRKVKRKTFKVTNEFAEIVGSDEYLSRGDAVKAISTYAKEKGLADGTKLKLDDKLSKALKLDVKEVSFYDMTRNLSNVFIVDDTSSETTEIECCESTQTIEERLVDFADDLEELTSKYNALLIDIFDED